MRRVLLGLAVAGAMIAAGPGAGAEPTCTPTPVVVCTDSQTDPNPAVGVTIVDPSSGTLVLAGLSGESAPPFATGCAIVNSAQASDGGCVIVVSDGSSQATILLIRFGPEPSCTRIDLPSGEQGEC